MTHEVAGDGWFGFDRVRVLGDDVALVPLVGHTRGHCGVAIKDESGWLVHAGDAYFFHGEVDPLRPRSTPGLAVFQSLIAMDDAARKNNQRRLRELLRDHGAEVRVLARTTPTSSTRLTRTAPTRRSTRSGEVLDEESSHLVGRVVMNPVGRLRDVDDPCTGDPVRRGIGERGVEMLLLVTPDDEGRRVHLGPGEQLADAVPEARSIPVDGGVERPEAIDAFDQVVDVLGESPSAARDRRTRSGSRAVKGATPGCEG